VTSEQVQKSIRDKSFKPIYFLTGDESYFIDQLTTYFEQNALEEHERAFNQIIAYGKDSDAQTLMDLAARFPMMAPYQLIILKEAQLMDKIEGLDPYIKSPNPNTILVICYKDKKLDQRTAFAKSIKANGVIVESKKLYDDKIPGWISTYLSSLGIKIGQEASTLIAEHIGNDLEKVSNELDKLALNIPKGSNVSLSDIQKFIGISKEYNVFELQKALTQRSAVRSYKIALQMIENPKSANIVMIIGALFAYFTKIYRLHSLRNPTDQEIAKTAGVNPFFASEYKQGMRAYPKEKLEEIFEHLRIFDQKVKGFGASGHNTQDLLKEMIFRILH
jgi:DNA polymerase III subunit delta